MNTLLWSLLAGAVVVASYLLAMRVLVRQSKDADKQVDFTKIKPWVDGDRRD